jgi:hypothetical protein
LILVTPLRHAAVVLAAGALSLAAAGGASAKRSPCKAPASGFRACLRVLHRPAAAGPVANVRVTATLLRRVDRCPRTVARRRVVLTRQDGSRLAALRRPGGCHAGVERWVARVPAADTASWGLQVGDRVHARWDGGGGEQTVVIVASG